MSTYSVYSENGGNSDGCVTYPISEGVSLVEALDIWERQVESIKENGTAFISRPIYMGHGRFREEETSNWHHVYFVEDDNVLEEVE